jgi:opacity protein-like surface antigen
MRKLALLFLLACAPAAWAQYGEIWFSGGEMFYKNAGLGTQATLGGSDNDVHLENGFRFAFRVALNGDSLFGHEVQYAYNRTQLVISSPSGSAKAGMAVHIGGYNFLLYANHEGNRFRPFATGGVHFANFVWPGLSAYSGGGDNKFGFSYGGGLKVRVRGPIALRIDARQYTNPKPFQHNYPLYGAGGWIRMNELSAGVGFVF